MRPLASFGPNVLKSRAHCPGLTIYILGKVLLEIFGEYIFRELRSSAAQEEKDTESLGWHTAALSSAHDEFSLLCFWIWRDLCKNQDICAVIPKASWNMREHTEKSLKRSFSNFSQPPRVMGKALNAHKNNGLKNEIPSSFAIHLFQAFKICLRKG